MPYLQGHHLFFSGLSSSFQIFLLFFFISRSSGAPATNDGGESPGNPSPPRGRDPHRGTSGPELIRSFLNESRVSAL